MFKKCPSESSLLARQNSFNIVAEGNLLCLIIMLVCSMLNYDEVQKIFLNPMDSQQNSKDSKCLTKTRF